MIQIIERSFNSIEDATKFANIILISYDHVQDIEFINNVPEKFIVLIKVNIEGNYELYETFDLAKLSKEKSDVIQYVWQNSYKISFDDIRLKEAEIFKRVENSVKYYNQREYNYYLTLTFGLKDFINAIEIRSTGSKNEIILNKFYRDNYYGYFSRTEKHLITEVVDYKVLFEHVLDVYKQRGYLFDKESINTLKTMFSIIAGCINEKKIKEQLNKKS